MQHTNIFSKENRDNEQGLAGSYEVSIKRKEQSQ